MNSTQAIRLVEELRNRLAAEGLLRGSDEKVLRGEEAIEEIENLRDRLAAEGLSATFSFLRADYAEPGKLRGNDIARRGTKAAGVPAGDALGQDGVNKPEEILP